MGCDPVTFLVDPEPVDAYAAWRDALDLEARRDEIRILADNNEKLRKIYDNIVPSQVYRWHSEANGTRCNDIQAELVFNLKKKQKQ